MSEQEVQDWIGKQVANNDVVLFMKGTKQMPQCGFSMQVAQIPITSGSISKTSTCSRT
jgi:monothiol glutaredoxin